MDDCLHEWTPLAPEMGSEPHEIWEWCIRCGWLRLGTQVFRPGEHQKVAIIAEEDEK